MSTQTTREQAIQRLRGARTVSEIRAAMLFAFPLAEDPLVAEEMHNAQQRSKERQARQRVLDHDTHIIPAREPSHDNRETLLQELRTRRANGVSLRRIEKSLKNACHDDKCGAGKCSGTLQYKSLCMQFLTECIAARLKITLVRRHALNRYPFPADLAALMTRFMADPINTWLDFPEEVYNIGPRLERFFDAHIEPLQYEPNPKPIRDEAKSFRRHFKRIRDMLVVLQRCEQPPVT